MRAIRVNMLFDLALVGWIQPAVSSQSYCATGEVSPIALRVTVRPERRQDFIRFLQSDRSLLPWVIAMLVKQRGLTS